MLTAKGNTLYEQLKYPDCSRCKKSVAGNVFFRTEEGVLCYACKGKKRKEKKRRKKK